MERVPEENPLICQLPLNESILALAAGVASFWGHSRGCCCGRGVIVGPTMLGPPGHFGVGGLGQLALDHSLQMMGGWCWCWGNFWETDHFLGAPGNRKNCSPSHVVTHERGLGGIESPGNDDAMENCSDAVRLNHNQQVKPRLLLISQKKIVFEQK